MGEVDEILEHIEVEISKIDLYDYDIIETSLSMIHKLQAILNNLRTRMQTYVFPTKEDEILFFKTQKPELLGRLLFSIRYTGLKRNARQGVMKL